MKFRHEKPRGQQTEGSVIPDIIEGTFYALILPRPDGFYTSIQMLDHHRDMTNRQGPYSTYDIAVEKAKALLQHLEGEKPDWIPPPAFG